MSKLIDLKIKNFRGIKTFEHAFKGDFICLIGRGDTSKTTILDAISYVLSGSRSLSFYDTDFYNCDTTKDIEIEATVINVPAKLIAENKYYSHVRVYNLETRTISDDIKDDIQEKGVPALTIKLKVNKYLEPKWVLFTTRSEETEIYASDREKLNCNMISDYATRYFSWTRGNPLYSLLNITNKDGEEEDNTILEEIRKAKERIDDNTFETFSEALEIVKKAVLSLGLNIENVKTTIDFKDIVLKEGQVCLHDDKIPFRLKGKGSRRLISMAIQLSIVNSSSGIILIDEIEQGLEPDRIKQVLRSIQEQNKGQVFITTHSRDAVVELKKEDIFLVRKKQKGDVSINDLSYKSDKLQGAIRACPEAFFAKKIIICEGATEIGFCRAVDKHYESTQGKTMSFADCAYVDGGGDNLFDRAKEMVPYFDKVCILMDSDPEPSKKDAYNAKKTELKELGIEIFDCEEGYNIESQVFKNISWEGVQALLSYVSKEHNKTTEQILHAVQSKDSSIHDLSTDSTTLRKALSKIAVDSSWFKRIDRGEAMGDIVINKLPGLGDDSSIKKNIDGIISWINQ